MPFDTENFKPKIVPQGGHARTLYEVLIPEFELLHEIVDKQQEEISSLKEITSIQTLTLETITNLLEKLVKERNNAETAINTDSGNKTTH